MRPVWPQHCLISNQRLGQCYGLVNINSWGPGQRISVSTPTHPSKPAATGSTLCLGRWRLALTKIFVSSLRDCGLTYIRTVNAFVSKVMVFDKPGANARHVSSLRSTRAWQSLKAKRIPPLIATSPTATANPERASFDLWTSNPSNLRR